METWEKRISLLQPTSRREMEILRIKKVENNIWRESSQNSLAMAGSSWIAAKTMTNAKTGVRICRKQNGCKNRCYFSYLKRENEEESCPHLIRRILFSFTIARPKNPTCHVCLCRIILVFANTFQKSITLQNVLYLRFYLLCRIQNTLDSAKNSFNLQRIAHLYFIIKKINFLKKNQPNWLKKW